MSFQENLEMCEQQFDSCLCGSEFLTARRRMRRSEHPVPERKGLEQSETPLI